MRQLPQVFRLHATLPALPEDWASGAPSTVVLSLALLADALSGQAYVDRLLRKQPSSLQAAVPQLRTHTVHAMRAPACSRAGA